MKKLQRLRLLTRVCIGLTAGMMAEPFTSMKTIYVINNWPGLLSIMFFVSSVIGCLQFTLSRLNLRKSIWFPIWFDAVIISLVSYLFFNQQYLYCIGTIILVESITSVLFVNRANRILEIIKHGNDLGKFYNMQASLFSGGMLVGYLISFLLVKLGISYENIWFIGYMSWVIPMYPILFFENKIIMKYNNL